ncbi:MAG: type II secretion system F family protein [Phycisphaerales bacterium]|nr:type II secretion system F family protein [Phycisphaerales bacterium]|tara:strand:- start:4976 stop:6208 length:1233 start_codon:yes stop_codon:yes gene_type:complete
MPQYRYQARLNTGRLQGGVLNADSAAAAATMLRSQGQHVLKLVPLQGAGSGDLVKKFTNALNWSSGPTPKEVLDFTSQLAVMIRAGISIRQALEGIADQTENAKFKKILQAVRQDVESGKQFSEAIAKYPRLFDALYVNMVKASEMSGSFAHMLDRIATFMKHQLETRKMVIGASIYPGVIATIATSVTIFLMTFVLPRFATVFEGKEAALPWPTKFLMATSNWMVANWWLLVLVPLMGIIGFIFFIRTEVGRFWFDGMRLKVPLFKPMFRALYVSRSLQTMGELLNAGVPVLDAMTVTGDITGNVLYRGLWRKVHLSVRQGQKINVALSGTSLLPRSVVQMMAAGEDSGKLGEVLEEIAGFYASALRDAIKTMTSMIEPILIVLMGSIVGFIAMAIILPIFKMSAIVSG